MWILSSDGDFLQGKRVWLKPGKKYLFGRVKSDGVCHAIDHKSISRQHLVVDVGHVQPGDGSHIHARSKIVLTDQSSKGTIVDGETVHKQSKELGGRDRFTIKLGRYPRALRITWCPIVLTFSFPSKELKAKDPLSQVRSRVEDLDIKAVLPYVTEETSHVVQNKRNTSKALQALVNSKPIVQKSYIEAIVYAATPSDLENEEALCPLEDDFDASWPDPRPHLPPRGKEPTELPDSAYEPDSRRSNIFDGYTFVFCDSARFEELQGSITSGHGEALLYDIDNTSTTAQDIVDYVRKAAGSKGLANEADGSGGVIIVQFQGQRGHKQRAQTLQQEVTRLIGQKIIEPSEFLDAILRNDASKLCRPTTEDGAGREVQASTGTTRDKERTQETPQYNDIREEAAPIEVEQGTGGDAPASADAAVSETVPRPANRFRTRAYIPKFKAFDDDFDMDSIPAYTLAQDGETTEEATQVHQIQSVAEENVSQPPVSEEDNVVTELLPGAAAMKQRLGEKKRRQPTPPPEPTKKPKRPKLDVKEAARQRREAEDEAATAQRERDVASFQAVAEDMDLAQLQNLAIIEEMTVRPRSSEPRGRRGVSDSQRCDERWHGRKNFKKFRRKGNAAGTVQHKVKTVIVPVEEVKRKDFGLNEEYSSTSRVASGASRASQPENRTSQHSQVDSQPSAAMDASRKRSREPDDSDDDGLRFRFRRKRDSNLTPLGHICPPNTISQMPTGNKYMSALMSAEGLIGPSERILYEWLRDRGLSERRWAQYGWAEEGKQRYKYARALGLMMCSHFTAKAPVANPALNSSFGSISQEKKSLTYK